MDDLLTAQQAGKILGVNASRVRQFILEGRLPACKFANAWMIKARDLEKVKDRKPGRPKKTPQASQAQAKGGDPARLPVGKPSGGK